MKKEKQVLNKEFSIGELAAEFDVTTRALRFYEEKGMLNPTRVNQKRIFSNSDRTRLKLILRGKRLGLSLEESAEIINMYNSHGSNKNQIHELIAAVREKRKQLKAQQIDLELMLLDLRDAEERCLVALTEQASI
jgi:DNA-binding transcriptional MerR regulator